MPYAFENRKLRLPESLDRRRKISPEQRERMFLLRSTGHSYKSIARDLGIAKSTVMYILSPKRREMVRAYQKEHWRRYAEMYKSQRNAVATEHRHYKHKLMQEGLLGKTTKEETK